MNDYDDEHTGQQDEDEDRDVITQIADRGVVGSDDEDTTFVPNQRTLTRSGRLAGTWKKHFALEDDLREDENSSESDSEENDKSEEDNHQIKSKKLTTLTKKSFQNLLLHQNRIVQFTLVGLENQTPSIIFEITHSDSYRREA